MKLTYKQYESIPLKANFIDYLSGSPVDITFQVPANTSLTSATGGLVKFSVFLSGTTTVANSTLNGVTLPLQNLYMTAYSSSGNYAVYTIAEGLTGGTTNPTAYDVSGYYRKTDSSGNTLTEIPVFYTFYVSSNSNAINPRIN